MLGFLAVVFGGGLGAVLRHGVNRVAPLLVPSTFPVSTLFVNVAGSLIMGLLAGWFTWRSEQASLYLRLFLTTGVLGGFTTFSAFSLDVALLCERGQGDIAVGYVAASLGGSLIGVFIGLAAARALLS